MRDVTWACDRCRSDIPGRGMSDRPPLGVGWLSYPAYNESMASLDLCTSCMEAFRVWWKNPEKRCD